MANNLNVDIVATDKTQQGAASAKKTLGGVAKSAQKEITAVLSGKGSFAEFSKKMTASSRGDEMSKVLGALGKSKVGGNILSYAKGFGEVAEAAEVLAGSIGVLGVATGGLALGLGVGAAAAYAFAKPFISGAAGVAQLSASLGLAGKDIQAFEGAAKRIGVTKEGADQALAGLGNAAHLALTSPSGGSQRAFFGAAGIDVHKFADRQGRIDTTGLMVQVARAIAAQGNAQAQDHLAQALGVTSALPLLRQGGGYLTSNMKSSPAFGYYTDEDARRGLQGAQDDVINGQFKDRLFRGARRAVAENGVEQGLDVIAGGLSGVVGANRSAAPTDVAKVFGALSSTPQASMLPNRSVASLGGMPDLSSRSVAAGLSSSLPSVQFGAVVTQRFAPAADKLAASADALQKLADGVHTSGMRRNNPGNLRPTSGRGFESYGNIVEGLDSMGHLLRVYQHKHGLDTIDGIINRYAPPSDNNPTQAYKDNVARRTGFGKRQRLDLDDDNVLATLMGGMITQEQGRNPFTSAQVSGALQQGGSAMHVYFHVIHEGDRVRTKIRAEHSGGVYIHHDSTGRH